MSVRLRDLIRTIRGCKTAAEERSQVSKECAQIRTALKDEDNPYRARNVAKLMYIHMLGYPTHFGQMECVRLITSNKYPEKRIGYLGLMLLLDENQEVLTLVENQLAKDLRDSNQFVQSLALSTIANISSSDIARDLSSEVEKLLFHANPYVRKKAALCAVRIFRKVPELVENYVEKLPTLLTERSHGVLLTAVTLLIESLLAQIDGSGDDNKSLKKNQRYNQIAESYSQAVLPGLVRILRNLMMSSYALEHDVAGIADPFLQVKILKLMKMLAVNSPKVSEHINDVLAQVATNTESSKNAGNAILYECVHTIMDIESEGGLRVLAINILGRFLMNRDNNIRYVALNTLNKVVSVDVQSVQRHRNTIVDCLKDPDISIRRRALDLVYLLVNPKNISELMPEMLNFLQNSELEYRQDLTTKICSVIERHSPTKLYQIDTMIKILSMSGKYVREELCAGLIALISQTQDLQKYAVNKLYVALKAHAQTGSIGPVDPLTQVSVWCIGEYGDLLVQTSENAEIPAISEAEVVNLLADIMHRAHALSHALIREYTLTALTKLAARYPSQLEVVQEHIDQYKTSISLETQQRSCEFSALLRSSNRYAVLDKMPAIEKEKPDAEEEEETVEEKANGTAASSSINVRNQSNFGNLLELQTDSLPVISNNTPATTNANLLDFLTPLDVPVAPTTKTINTSNDNVFDLLGGSLLGDFSNNMAPATKTMTAFNQNGLAIDFEITKEASENAGECAMLITAKFKNSLSYSMDGIVFQAAVPKYMKLNLYPPSANNVPANSNGAVTQQMRVVNTQHPAKPLMMKVKIMYKIQQKPVEEQATVTNFPSL